MMGGSVSLLARIGECFLIVYDPQRRTTRKRFAQEAALWLAAGVGGWLSLDPIADATWISDEMLLHVARIVSWSALAWSAALFPMLARRFHDAGLSGAWAGLALVPMSVPVLLAAAMALPSRRAGLAWPAESARTRLDL